VTVPAVDRDEAPTGTSGDALDGAPGGAFDGAPDGAADEAPDRAWRYAVLAVVAISVVAHIWKLGVRPLAHDEAIDARFSWQARNFGVMEYDPVYHGPLRFYLEGMVLRFFGISAGWTRLVAALAGIASTALIATSRRTLGRVGSIVAALVFVVSPTVLTVTRTGREDSLTGLVSLGLLLIVARSFERPTTRQAIAVGALLATSATIKETTFIFGFAAACFVVGLAVVALLRPDGAGRRWFRGLGGLGLEAWMWSAVAFLAVFMVVFTSGFRYAGGLESGALDGIRYWLGQHDVGRGSQRWHFYITILLGYEGLMLLLAGIGLAWSIRRRSVVGAWFATMAFVQLAVYSWAGEKFAWLALHPVIPLVLLGGLGAQAVADRNFETTTRRALAAALAVALVGTGALAVRPAITDGDDPRELLVTVQTSRSVPEIAARLQSMQDEGSVDRILIDERDSGSWPWAWYAQPLREVAYATIDPALPLPEGYDAYIVSASTDLPPVPTGFAVERFALRRWWLPDYDDVSIGDLARWFVTRETWNDTGSSDQFFIVRTDDVVEQD
jgi:uncharacterized protein (TIGR03663 family)